MVTLVLTELRVLLVVLVMLVLMVLRVLQELLEAPLMVELVVVVAVSPLVLVMAVLVAGWLRVVAGTGVVLRQRRVGRGGRPFTLV